MTIEGSQCTAVQIFEHVLELPLHFKSSLLSVQPGRRRGAGVLHPAARNEPVTVSRRNGMLCNWHVNLVQYVLGGRPEEGVVMGALLLAMAAGNAPLVMRFFAGTPGPPRLLALVATAGVLLMVVRPPLPLKVGSHLKF